MIDFDRNTYQYEIAFKFDCISPDLVAEIVRQVVFLKKMFSFVTKDAQSNQTVLSVGQGTDESPAFQLRIGPDKVLAWAGWFVSLQKWQDWRNGILSELAKYLGKLPLESIAWVSTQNVVAIPNNRLRPGDTIPELAPIRSFYKRFVPPELLNRSNASLAFADDNLRELLTLVVGGTNVPLHENITFGLRWNAVDDKADLGHNLLAHAARSDKLLDNLDEGLISLFLKAT